MLVSKDLQVARLAICESCPELTTLSRCQKCGCFMTGKTRLTKAKCPLNKWPKVEEWTTKNLNEDLVK
jgi:hypothetical protein